MSNISRRTVISGIGAAAAMPLLPTRRASAASSLVVAMYPSGSHAEVFNKVVKPAVLAKHDIDLTFDYALALDQVAKAAASRGKPPFDVFFLDPGPRASAIDLKLFRPFDASKLTNRSALPPVFVDEWGVGVAAQINGIAYNPKKVEAPKGWLDLLGPKYYGKVGLTGFTTSTSTAVLLEMNKLLGGTVQNVEPLFKKLKEFVPNAGAVVSPANVSSLFAQGQIDVFWHTYTEVAALKARGVDIEFAKPETGMIMFYNSVHIAAGAQAPELAYKYIDTIISREIQAALQAKPYNFLGVNSSLSLANDFPPTLIKSLDDLKDMVTYDWGPINEYRPGWIERFNKEVAT